jgi:hypothetical protein
MHVITTERSHSQLNFNTLQNIVNVNVCERMYSDFTCGRVKK